jgi:hypothetical protein
MTTQTAIRMDRADLESGDRMHQDFTGLQALLCRNHGKTSASHGGSGL